MEEEIEKLKKKVAELENEVATQNDDEDQKLADAPEPRGLKRQEYDYVEGWKIVDLKIMNEALEIAQKCGHSQVVLVESNRKKMRADLAAHLAYVCITCGRQTVFSNSSYSQEEPANYVVNKEFSAVGLTAYFSVVNIVQSDKTILAVPQDRKILDKRPTFLFKYDDSDEGSSGDKIDSEPTKPIEVDLPTEVKSEPFIKDEPEDYLEDYLEPTISLTEEDAATFDDDHFEPNIKEEDADEEDDHTADGPQIDVSTITTNTPLLAMATVKPNTPVLGGMVTPWAPHLIINVHPSLFIRTTCSKIMLPPGLFSYQRNNGLKSIMSVRADSGTFDSIESHYHMSKTNNLFMAEKNTGKKVDNMRWDTKVRKTYTSAHRKTPLQIYSQDCKRALAHEGIPKEDWDKHTIDRWSRLAPEAKQEYKMRALMPHGKSPEVEPQARVPGEKKKSTNIPLPALKKFAGEVAPGLKKKKPYLAKIENRGQLNKHILELWMELSPAEQMSYKMLAGMSVDDSPASPAPSDSQSQQQGGPSQRKTIKLKVKKKDDSDSDSEYIPSPSKRRRPV